jgi:hypothetical protein
MTIWQPALIRMERAAERGGGQLLHGLTRGGGWGGGASWQSAQAAGGFQQNARQARAPAPDSPRIDLLFFQKPARLEKKRQIYEHTLGTQNHEIRQHSVLL